MKLKPNTPFQTITVPLIGIVDSFVDNLNTMNLKEEDGGRWRGTARATVCGNTGQVLPYNGIETEKGSVIPYYLPNSLNTDYRGVIRMYNNLNTLHDGSSFWINPLIKWLTGFQLSEHPVVAPYYEFEVMVIRYKVTEKQCAIVTPNSLHFDRLGENTRSCILTVERNNVKGGAFVIADGSEVGLHILDANEEALLYNKEVPVGEGVILDERPWSNNQPVCHSATETFVSNPLLAGYRTILVTEMTPVFPIIH